MTYTEKEIEILKANTKKIANYLHSIQPEIREKIKIEFGDTVSRGALYAKEKEYEIIICKDRLFGFSGNLRFEFKDESDIKSSGVVSVYSPGFGTSYMGMLIRDWNTIKHKIKMEMKKQEQNVRSIYEFTL